MVYAVVVMIQSRSNASGVIFQTIREILCLPRELSRQENRVAFLNLLLRTTPSTMVLSWTTMDKELEDGLKIPLALALSCCSSKLLCPWCQQGLGAGADDVRARDES